MATEGKKVSISQLCRCFCFPRSSFYYRPKPRKPRVLDKNAVEEIRAVMEEFPLYGVPRLTVILNQHRETPINRKKVARIVRINNWQLNRRPKDHRP